MSSEITLPWKNKDSVSFVKDFFTYVGRVSEFSAADWLVYLAWVGMMYGLFAVVTFFLWIGWSAGVEYPAYVWNLPVGIFIFSTAIAIDTIGHRTIYRAYLERMEALVHHITIFAGITSVVVMCLGYHFPVFLKIPALVLIALSILYSIIDEAMHCHRYMTQKSDRVEMWSHFFIFVGHNIMVLAWWQWFSEAYPGVDQTLAAMPKIF